MEFKRVSKIIYRIEPKPEGGFIARAADPSVEPLEAPTREELQQKIKARAFGEFAVLFPGLKLSQGSKQIVLEANLGRQPGKSFTLQGNANDSSAAEQAQSVKEIAGIIAKNFPEISKALTSPDAQAGNSTLKNALLSTGLPVNRTELKNEPFSGLNVGAANSPITPESSSSWKIFLFLLALAVPALFALAFLLRHH